MKSRPVLTVDLGSTKIACAVGRPRPVIDNGFQGFHGAGRDPGFELLGCGLASYPLGERSWPCDPALMTEVLEQALLDLKVEPLPESAFVILTHPDATHARVIAHIDIADEPVPIRSRELARLKSQALSQALALDRDVLDLETLGYAGNGFDAVKDPRGLPATRLSGRFQLVTVPLAVKRAVMRAFEAVGLEVERLTYGLTAVARAWSKELWSPTPSGRGGTYGAPLQGDIPPPAPPRLGGVARMAGSVAPATGAGQAGNVHPIDYPMQRLLLIDVGGSSTDLAIVDNGSLARTQTIRWGGSVIAEQVARACRMTLEQALTASLEGFTSPKPAVRDVLQQQVGPLRQAIQEILEGLTIPSQAVVTGRGALIDGMVEWIGATAQMSAVLGRSPRMKEWGDLNRQIALSPSIALLELVLGGQTKLSARPLGLVNRVLDRTRQILIEYF